MKYLELECTRSAEEDLLRIEESFPGLSMRLEVYSLKKTRKEKKTTRSWKYKSISSMVSAALNLAFFGYEEIVSPYELIRASEEEVKSILTNKLFTIGLTKSYLSMSSWVVGVFQALKEAGGEDAVIYRLIKSTGPFEKCIWNECVLIYGKELKRVVLFIVLYQNAVNSPIL